ERLPRFLDRRRADLVLGWCDWVDEILRVPAPQPVLAHGDLHGFNQVWRRSSWTLLLVADFEVAGPADPEYDFRYFPSQDPTRGFVTAIRHRYMSLTGRTVDMDRGRRPGAVVRHSAARVGAPWPGLAGGGRRHR